MNPGTHTAHIRQALQGLAKAYADYDKGTEAAFRRPSQFPE